MSFWILKIGLHIDRFRHYPVGVLFDLLKADDLLPWTIVLKTKVCCPLYFYMILFMAFVTINISASIIVRFFALKM